MTLGRHWRSRGTVLAVALSHAIWLAPDEPPEAELKSAFTLNFAKFAHWPDHRASAGGAVLDVCVVGRSPVGQALEQTAGIRVAGRRLKVRYIRLPGDVSDCHIVYVSKLEASRSRRILGALSPEGVLTVSDVQGFVGNGGMIELVVHERRLRFAIDLAAVRAAGLRLEPSLLRLAIRLDGVDERIPEGQP